MTDHDHDLVAELASRAAALQGVDESAVDALDDGILVQLVASGATDAMTYRGQLLDGITDPPTVGVLLADATAGNPTWDVLAGAAAERRAVFEPPRDDRERLLCETVAASIDRAPVGAEDDLFDLGVDSLALIELTTVVYEQESVELDLQDVFDAGTPRGVARLISRRTDS